MSKKLQESQEKIIQALRTGATMQIASDVAGVGRSTIYKWIAKGEQPRAQKIFKNFAERVRAADAHAAMTALETITHSIQEGDVKSAMWLLSRRHGYKNDAQHAIPEAEEETHKSTDTLDYRTMLTIQISELKQSMTKAKDSGSWQAYAALQRQLITMLQTLKTYDAEEGAIDAHERMTDDQLMSEIVNTIIAPPPILRQRVQADLHSLVGSNVVALKKA